MALIKGTGLMTWRTAFDTYIGAIYGINEAYFLSLSYDVLFKV